jgi:hypothetical protein
MSSVPNVDFSKFTENVLEAEINEFPTLQTRTTSQNSIVFERHGPKIIVVPP